MPINAKAYIESAANNLGVDPTRLWSELLAAQAAGVLSLAPDGDTASVGLRGLASLTQFVSGQGNVSDVPIAMRGAVSGIFGRMEVREIPPERASRRPAVVGFPEALFDWISALRTSKSGLLEKARPSAERHQFLLGHILPFRALHAELDDARGMLLRDLGGYEREAADMLLADYGLVRAAVQSDRELRRALERVEAYLFGPAQQAVETRARTVEAGRTMAGKMLATEHARGVSEGEQRMVDKFSAAVDGEAAPMPATDPDDRRGGSR